MLLKFILCSCLISFTSASLAHAEGALALAMVPQKNSPSSPPPTTEKSAKADDDLSLELDKAKLNCGMDKCPDNVGMIGMIIETFPEKGMVNFGQCTGFLYAKNIVATNSHCMDGLPSEVQDCSKVVAIQFAPSEKEEKKTFRCKKLLAKSDRARPDLAPDHAFFEIEESAREPISVARANGIPVDSSLYIIKIDPAKKGKEPSASANFGGTMVKEGGISVQGSVLNPFYTSEFAGTALIIGTQVEHGNSGSPVFDANTNQAVGIAQAFFDENVYLPKALLWLKELHMFPKQLLPKHTMLTNLSCVPDPLTGAFENKDKCAPIDERNYKRAGWLSGSNEVERAKMLTLATNIEKDPASKALLSEWIQSLPPIAAYGFYMDWDMESGAEMISAIPICFRPLTDWPDSAFETGSQVGPNAVELFVKYGFRPRLKLKIGFDAQLRLNITGIPQKAKEPEAQLHILISNGTVLKGEILEGEGGLPLLQENFPECSPAALETWKQMTNFAM